ncbi:TetR family transcriptional regulator C-terminal domain-containing protein, partial [Staphylococcus aureus]|nr:TetR family transcriptional regulator C-terminal domain-containing protein [Staphylococcus aureus]
MSQDYPRESRLFAHEILQGAPHLTEILGGDLRQIVDRTVAVRVGWMARGLRARAEPRHLIFSIWSMTQHYADFETQVRAVL